MSALSAHLNPALNSSDPTLLKGAYEALAVSAEGCSDHIRKKYLITFLKYLDTGIKHQIPAKRKNTKSVGGSRSASNVEVAEATPGH